MYPCRVQRSASLRQKIKEAHRSRFFNKAKNHIRDTEYIQFNTHSESSDRSIGKGSKKIRLEQISHDITVLNVAIYFHKITGISFQDIRTEKQLHSIDGFSNRRHRPDFIYIKDGKTTCVEVELSLKNKERLEKNIKQDFVNYDFTYWVVPDIESKIAQIVVKKTESPIRRLEF